MIAYAIVDEQRKHLALRLERLSDHQIVINADKCELGKKELIFLGQGITREGIKPCEDKVRAVLQNSTPTTVKDLKAFPGLLNFYRRFIPHAAERLLPLTDMLRGNPRKQELTGGTQAYFDEAESALAQTTLLVHQSPSATLSPAVDASNTAIGGVLQQKVSDFWQPLKFYSRRISPTEARYSTFGRELLAAYESIKHFRHAVEGREFILFTDHKPLTYALHTKSDRYSPRETRHLDYVSQFTNDLRHLEGEANSVADALSRININAIQTTLDFSAMAAAQSQDNA